jgi:hypothetical protein
MLVIYEGPCISGLESSVLYHVNVVPFFSFFVHLLQALGWKNDYTLMFINTSPTFHFIYISL